MASQAPIFAAALMLMAAFVASGCKRPEPRSAESVPPESAGQASPRMPEVTSDEPLAPELPAEAGEMQGWPPPPSPTTAPPPAPPAPAAKGPLGPPLPELTLKSFGLHLPGGHDTEERRAVLRALERSFPRYMDCYRTIETPGAEGTFGADLRVPTEGGRAKLVQSRTRLPGDAFKSCMTRALESVRFDPPPTGRPRMVSYSVKFSFAR